MPIEIRTPSDEDLFPFGAHKGKPYGSVPAHYFDWLRDQSWLDKWPEVKAYMKANQRVIDHELDREAEGR